MSCTLMACTCGGCTLAHSQCPRTTASVTGVFPSHFAVLSSCACGSLSHAHSAVLSSSTCPSAAAKCIEGTTVGAAGAGEAVTASGSVRAPSSGVLELAVEPMFGVVNVNVQHIFSTYIPTTYGTHVENSIVFKSRAHSSTQHNGSHSNTSRQWGCGCW